MTHKLFQQWAGLKKYDKAAIVFIGFLTLLSLFGELPGNQRWRLVFLHLLAVVMLWLVPPYLEKSKFKIIRFVRDWYLAFSIPFIYWDVGNFIHAIFPHYFDSWIVAFEEALLGFSPNLWVQRLVTPLLTEVMQLSYALYWFTIPAGGELFYLNRRYREFEHLLFYVATTFFLSYVLFIFFPVRGPRFYLAQQITASYKGLVFGTYLRGFVNSAGLHGGAFPSSHVAVAVVTLLFVWKFFPRLAKRFFLPAVIALSLATIYGQYHYLTDVLAGGVMGWVIGWYGIRRL